MTVTRIWLTTEKPAENGLSAAHGETYNDVKFVAETVALTDPDGMAHIVADREQLTILYDRIRDVLTGDVQYDRQPQSEPEKEEVQDRD